jgi:uncharacterized protein Smg (DUF494 family)
VGIDASRDDKTQISDNKKMFDVISRLGPSSMEIYKSILFLQKITQAVQNNTSSSFREPEAASTRVKIRSARADLETIESISPIGFVHRKCPELTMQSYATQLLTMHYY